MKVRKVWLIKKIFFPTKYHIQQIGITPVASQGKKQFQKKYFKENLSIFEFFFFFFLFWWEVAWRIYQDIKIVP